MKYLLASLVYLFVSLANAESCALDKLVGLKDIRSCAEGGDKNAQYMLGMLYFHGKEVPKNYKTSFEWMSKSARQGDKDAQNALAFDYFNGWSTKKDHVLAYIWWSLSIVNNEEPVTRKNLERLEQELSPSDLAKAQKMASDWSPGK